MRKVKGVLLKFFVKSIRANKTGIYNDLLSEEDMGIVNKRILDGAWYPYEVFKNCFNAVCKVDGRDNVKVIQKWGYNRGKETLERLYKEPLMKRDLSGAVNSYNTLFKLWFNFGKQYGEIQSENNVDIIIEDFDKDFRLFYYIAMGWMQGFFEIYTGISITAKFLEKPWEGADKMVVNLSWNS